MRILFTVALADGFHGSVLHVKELAGYYASKGHECVVATMYHTEEAKQLFNDSGIDMCRLDQIDPEKEYDILFGIHYPTVSYLLDKGIKCKKLVLNSLSQSEPLEFFPAYYSAATMLITCSYEVREKHSKTLGIAIDDMYVLENPVPDEFAQYISDWVPSTDFPKKIAVVSNHIPDEIMALKDIAADCEITYFGIQTGNYRKVTPELLAEFDVVISIGKTIQYAMGMGIPAYEYDHFGGNGYITTDNMDTEAYYNFAGRNTRRKLTTEEIYNEITAQYKDVLANQPQLKEKALKRFLLSDRLDQLLEVITATTDFSYEKLYNCDYNIKAGLNEGNIALLYMGTYKAQAVWLENCVAQSKEYIVSLENTALQYREHSAALENIITAMQNSTSWKITAWLRKLISIFRK